MKQQSYVCIQDGQAHGTICEDGTCTTLNASHEQPIIIDRAAFNQGENAKYPPHVEQTDVMDTLVARGPHAVSYRMGGRKHDRQRFRHESERGADTYTKWDGSTGTAGKGALVSEEVAFTVAATQDQTLVAPEEGEYVVRRLTPTECERLQGFPDGWTDIPYKGKEHPPDGPRYKALGNSMAVPVIRMLGRRIEAFDILHYDEVGGGAS